MLCGKAYLPTRCEAQKVLGTNGAAGVGANVVVVGAAVENGGIGQLGGSVVEHGIVAIELSQTPVAQVNNLLKSTTPAELHLKY